MVFLHGIEFCKMYIEVYSNEIKNLKFQKLVNLKNTDTAKNIFVSKV